ncbi:MAG: sulfatase-like hydrolase/transferase, partial [Rhizobiaceae bacterium]
PEDSETPWLTREVIRFMESRSDEECWMCHASYIKPHWPYIVPEPYHDMFGKNHVPAATRSAVERENPHPVYEQFMNNAIGKAFRREEVRETVIPAYMGLIKQCDDQMGVLFDYMERSGRMDDTMIVITSDHGDYLGDHWLGEKDLFHEQSAKIPLIIYDPSPHADCRRGSVCDELVESIDLAATFVEFYGGTVPDHIIEGRSLAPYLMGNQPKRWRDFAISEYDYSATPMAMNLGLAPKDARLFMVADKRWKFMHAEGELPGGGGPFRPMLFDLESDPNEFHDLGASRDHQDIIDLMYERLGQWGRRLAQRTTRSEQDILNMRGVSRRKGIVLGVYDGSEADAELTVKYRGSAPARP